MKKTILALCLASTLFACKKETNSDSNNSPSSDAKVPVTFSVDNLSVTQQDMSANGRVESDTSLNRFSHLYYLVFDSDGKNIRYIYQDTTVNKVNFGSIADTLAPGTYTVAMAISTESLHVNSQDNTLRTFEFMSNFENGYSFGDMFYKKTQVTINASGDRQSFELSLNRMVGLLEFDLYDALPQSTPYGYGSIGAPTLGCPSAINLFTETYPTLEQNTGVRPKRINQTTLRTYILGSDYPIRIDLSWYDNTGKWFTKVIQNVKVNTNKKTIISGYLYGVPNTLGGGNFTMKFVQDWSADSTVIPLN